MQYNLKSLEDAAAVLKSQIDKWVVYKCASINSDGDYEWAMGMMCRCIHDLSVDESNHPLNDFLPFLTIERTNESIMRLSKEYGFSERIDNEYQFSSKSCWKLSNKKSILYVFLESDHIYMHGGQWSASIYEYESLETMIIEWFEGRLEY